MNKQKMDFLIMYPIKTAFSIFQIVPISNALGLIDPRMTKNMISKILRQFKTAFSIFQIVPFSNALGFARMQG